METDRDSPLSRKAKYIGWVLLLGLMAGHLIPYLPEYSVPTFDLYNVMHVINYLNSPELYGPDRISVVLTEIWTTTAPVYFYGLAYPISQFLSAKFTIFTLGFAISVLSAYFAGGRWEDWKDLLVCFVVIFLLIHTNVSPLEGNRRSFTAVFLLGLLWLETSPNYLGQLFLVASAAGIYPPVALLMLTYYGIKELASLREQTTTFRSALGRMTGFSIIFLIVLTPYWSQKVFAHSDPGMSMILRDLSYEIESLRDFVKTFLVGDFKHKGALFRDQLHFNFFLIFASLVALQKVVLEEKFVFKRKYLYLTVASLGLWVGAHLVYPLIYLPFKYTRISLLLVLAMPFAENLPSTVTALRSQFSKTTLLRLTIAVLSGWMLLIWCFHGLYPSNFAFLNIPGILGSHWWRFIFALPVFLVVTVSLPTSFQNRITRSFLSAVVLLAMVFLPHGFTTFHWLPKFDGMYKYLRTTPPGTKIAGPLRFYIHPVPALAKRSVYASKNKAMLEFACRRSKKLWKIYFATSPEKITSFMKENKIDYLLVDRRLLKKRLAGGVRKCIGNIPASTDPYLNRHFETASWRYKKRFYLVGAETLSSARLNSSPSETTAGE